MTSILDQSITSELKRDCIRKRLGVRKTVRDIATAIDEGISQADISDVLGESHAYISRVAQRIQLGPETVRRSPLDVIYERAVELISDGQMMNELMEWPYTFAEYPDEPLADGMIAGTWNDVLHGYYDDLVTEEELATLHDRVKPPR